MMITISKKFDFDAAHRLPNVDPNHKCFRMHGHTYVAEIICAGELDSRGMVCDYEEIAQAWQPVHNAIDHRLLNEVPGLENPTTEVLAPWILERLVYSRINHVLVAVRVYESATTWCEARL
jgi:6-pyruvoyltetrahydropterin/6-carboxytetrahydropterin synthase